MNIILLGEFSRLHNSLKEGLILLGHRVTIVGSKDYFKNYPVDFSTDARITTIQPFRFIHKVLRKLKIINLEKIEIFVRVFFFISRQNQIDYVQIINSDPFKTYPLLSRILFWYIFKKSSSKNLLLCGDETSIIDFYLKENMKYSILTPYIKNKSLKKEFLPSLRYLKKEYRKTFIYLVQNCHNLITSDLDYEIPMSKMQYKTHFIPNPVNTDNLPYKENYTPEKICIFLGINRSSYHKKGIIFFEEALNLIKEKFLNKVEIIITEDIPYNQYIGLYNRTHILLNQVYSYDQGYNALEAMAKGKVVFTGAEKEWLDYYGIEENKAVINAIPNVENIYKNLEFLIKNPEKINEIGRNARNFVENYHHYIKIAQKYLDVWDLEITETKKL